MTFFDSVVNYFHGHESFNRVTFGIDKYTSGRWLIHWRVTDLAFLNVLIFCYPLVGRIQPFQRQFTLNDVTIQHPFAEVERVTNLQLFFYSTWCPILLVGTLSLIVSKPSARLYTAYVSVLSVFISVFTTSIITDILKNHFGRLRPDFLARCIPAPGTPKDVLVLPQFVCTTKNIGRLMDGSRTTPLGHSSISFAGLLFASLWLCGQLKVTRPQVGAWRWAVSFIPTMGAMLIALSRVQDYRHHFVDVFLGLVIGSCIAVWLYFRIFPSIGDRLSHQPKMLLLAEEDELEYDPVNPV